MAAAFVLAPALVVPAQADENDENYPEGGCAIGSFLCTDVALSKQVLGYYTGHDEPAVLFYSNTPGSGNDMVYRLQLPRDPPIRPNEAGTGGTWNFQLHPAFWVGMALCDTTSAPEFTDQCPADTDANIFDDPDPASPHYVGKHPGTAFMELQFYPPGWVEWPADVVNAGGSSCDRTRWCAAMNVDSLLVNMNVGEPNTLGQPNNDDCRSQVGDETVNFAFLTRNGRSIAPADPLVSFNLSKPGMGGTVLDPQRITFFNSGDTLEVALHDTPDGLQASVHDLDTGATGSMTAGPSNGFAHVLYQPTASACSSAPYAFHPMYSTSNEHTRVPWAAHSYNIAFSDEIGHFEYCPNVQNASILGGTGVCASPSSTDPGGADSDDTFCFTAGMSSLVPLSGCTNSDLDFDGPAYGNNWPGTSRNLLLDRLLHSTPVRFTSPLIRGERNYERIAYETDLPAIEPGCNL
ncbi:MAG: hypothetical protein JOZ81_15435, partial [Chloroflexi bacterium]|nr:hypothetical protein [Chloroflexota bacterium]